MQGRKQEKYKIRLQILIPRLRYKLTRRLGRSLTRFHLHIRTVSSLHETSGACLSGFVQNTIILMMRSLKTNIVGCATNWSPVTLSQLPKLLLGYLVLILLVSTAGSY